VSGSFTAWLETQLLGQVFGGSSYTPPEAIYAALFTVAPAYSTGVGTEVGAPEYMRLEATWSSVTGVPPYSLNNNRMEWPCAVVPWGLVSSIVLLDAPISGNMLAAANLVNPIDGVTPAPKPIDPGTIFFIEIGGLMVAFTNPTLGAATASRRGRMTVKQAGIRRRAA
jgi:hypothetical protein